MQHNIDIAKIAALLEERAAVRIVPRFQNLRDDEIETKSNANDFVTIADREMEEDLCRILPQMVPGCIVIGEEGVSAGQIRTDALKDPTQIIFVTDPVDGTYNFRHGKREFATMLALVINGEVCAGWIYDVMGQMHYIGEKGAGSFCNGERITVAASKNLDDATGFMEAHYFGKDFAAVMEEQGSKKYRSLWCAGHEYLNVAAGRADFAIHGHMKPWDHLPGTLLVQEAGGVVEKFDGTPYRVTDSTGGLITASHPDVMRQIRERFIIPAAQRNVLPF